LDKNINTIKKNTDLYLIAKQWETMRKLNDLYLYVSSEVMIKL
jgi:hypothetical protein